MWRRMALWQVTSYRIAVDTELQQLRVVTLLRVHYGRRWRRRAHADLVWMLRTGVAVEEARERVGALVAVEDPSGIANSTALGSVAHTDRGASGEAIDAATGAELVCGVGRRCTTTAAGRAGRLRSFRRGDTHEPSAITRF